MSTALVLLDFQPAVIADLGIAPVIKRVGTALDAARGAGVQTVFVRVGFRNGTPEISQDSKVFAGLRGSNILLESDAATSFVDELAPRTTEPVVIKRRVGAFRGTDLDVVLKAVNADHLVIAGVMTGGAVLSTVRDAADRDFRLTVLADGCFDPDPIVHETLVSRVFPQSATVIDVADWIAEVEAGSQL